MGEFTAADHPAHGLDVAAELVGEGLQGHEARWLEFMRVGYPMGSPAPRFLGAAPAPVVADFFEAGLGMRPIDTSCPGREAIQHPGSR